MFWHLFWLHIYTFVDWFIWYLSISVSTNIWLMNVCIHRAMITNPNIDNIMLIAWKLEGHDICRLSNARYEDGNLMNQHANMIKVLLLILFIIMELFSYLFSIRMLLNQWSCRIWCFSIWAKDFRIHECETYCCFF